MRDRRPQRSRAHRVGRRNEHEGVGLFVRSVMLRLSHTIAGRVPPRGQESVRAAMRPFFCAHRGAAQSRVAGTPSGVNRLALWDLGLQSNRVAQAPHVPVPNFWDRRPARNHPETASVLASCFNAMPDHFGMAYSLTSKRRAPIGSRKFVRDITASGGVAALRPAYLFQTSEVGGRSPYQKPRSITCTPRPPPNSGGAVGPPYRTARERNAARPMAT
jgi:hypothetical protein